MAAGDGSGGPLGSGLPLVPAEIRAGMCGERAQAVGTSPLPGLP